MPFHAAGSVAPCCRRSSAAADERLGPCASSDLLPVGSRAMPCHLPAAPGRPCRPSLIARAATGGESLDGPEGHAGASGPRAARDGVLDQARADVGHPRPIDPDHARAGGLAPCHICAGTGAHCCHICTGGLGSLPHLRRDWGLPLPHLRRDSAHPSHICTGTRLTAVSFATSSLGLGSPVPHLQFFELILRLSHEKYSKLNALTKCLTQVGSPLATSAPGLGLAAATLAPGLGLTAATSAPDCARRCCTDSGLAQCVDIDILPMSAKIKRDQASSVSWEVAGIKALYETYFRKLRKVGPRWTTRTVGLALPHLR